VYSSGIISTPSSGGNVEPGAGDNRVVTFVVVAAVETTVPIVESSTDIDVLLFETALAFSAGADAIFADVLTETAAKSVAISFVNFLMINYLHFLGVL
jgi:hypothetical protein